MPLAGVEKPEGSFDLERSDGGFDLEVPESWLLSEAVDDAPDNDECSEEGATYRCP